jgi:hypothetical protein
MHSRQAARKESNRVNLRKSIKYSECCCSLHSNAIPKTKAAINVNLTTTENVSGQSKYRIKVNEKLQLRNGKTFTAEAEMRNKKYPKNYLLKYSLFPAFVILFRCQFLVMHARRNLPFTNGKQFAAPV